MGLMELVIAVKFQELVFSIHWMLIFNTNLGEATEFLGNYIDFKLIIAIVAFFVCGVLVYQLMRYIKWKRNSYIRKIAVPLAIVGIGCVLFSFINNLWGACGIGRAASQIIALKSFRKYDLSSSQKKFNTEEISSFHPENIILIIGESFDKLHSNIYGYNKITNPRLTARMNDSTLIAFSNISSSAPNTSQSIRLMLTLSEDINDNEWQTRPILPTFMKKSGYHTVWLSNQIANSVFDNVQEQLSLLSDEKCFTIKDFEILGAPDSVVFKPFSRYAHNAGDPRRDFIVVHLMGSHANYAKRYPEGFGHFKESDYPDQPEKRRETFAAYDNSILYNDYVVDKIMAMSDSLDAIVIYVPDHGQDFFYTRDVASHGRMSVPESFEAGCRIPFMIYFTPKFRAAHPNVVDRVFQFKDKKFETKYLMNTIMELSGYDIVNSNSYSNSLFEGELYK